MRARLIVLTGLVAFLLGPTPGRAQFPGGGPPGGPWPGGGPGGFGGGRSSLGGGADPNSFFNFLSGGKEVVVRSELDPRMQGMFDRMAERMNNSSGRLTRDQYLAYTQQRQTER